ATQVHSELESSAESAPVVESMQRTAEATCACMRELARIAAEETKAETVKKTAQPVVEDEEGEDDKAEQEKASPNKKRVSKKHTVTGGKLFVDNLKACAAAAEIAYIAVESKKAPKEYMTASDVTDAPQAALTLLRSFAPCTIDSFLLAAAGSVFDRFARIGKATGQFFLHHLFQALRKCPSESAHGITQRTLHYFEARRTSDLSSTLLPWLTANCAMNHDPLLSTCSQSLVDAGRTATKNDDAQEDVLATLATLLRGAVTEAAFMQYYNVSLRGRLMMSGGTRKGKDEDDSSGEDDEKVDIVEAATPNSLIAALTQHCTPDERQTFDSAPMLCVQLVARYLVMRGLVGASQKSVGALLFALFEAETCLLEPSRIQNAKQLPRSLYTPSMKKRRIALASAVEDVRKTLLTSLFGRHGTREFYAAAECALERAVESRDCATKIQSCDVVQVVLSACLVCFENAPRMKVVAEPENGKKRGRDEDEPDVKERGFDAEIVAAQNRILGLIARGNLSESKIADTMVGWKSVMRLFASAPTALAETCSQKILPHVARHAVSLVDDADSDASRTSAREMFTFLSQTARETPRKLLLESVNKVTPPLLAVLKRHSSATPLRKAALVVPVLAVSSEKSKLPRTKRGKEHKTVEEAADVMKTSVDVIPFPTDALCLAMSSYASKTGAYLSVYTKELVEIFLVAPSESAIQQLDQLLKTWLQAVPLHSLVPLFRDLLGSSGPAKKNSRKKTSNTTTEGGRTKRELLLLSYLFQHVASNADPDTLGPYGPALFDDMITPLCARLEAEASTPEEEAAARELIAALYAQCALRLELDVLT
ncbi:unnamed protein product, partial [Amoebophrya sp. A25]